MGSEYNICFCGKLFLLYKTQFATHKYKSKFGLIILSLGSIIIRSEPYLCLGLKRTFPLLGLVEFRERRSSLKVCLRKMI